MKCSFLTRSNDKLIFNGEYMEVYIPKFYFDKELAYFESEYFFTLGFFNFKIFANGEKKGKDGEMFTLKLPMPIKMSYDSFFDSTQTLVEGTEEEQYTVLVLKKGNVLIDNLKQKKSAVNTKNFLFLFHGGNVPKGIKYENLIETYLSSSLLNGTKLNNPSVIFELIVSELCRYKKNANEPFRKYIGKDSDKISSYDYSVINLKKLPLLNSTFNSLIFEDMEQSVITSVKKTRNNEKEKESPIEKVIKY